MSPFRDESYRDEDVPFPGERKKGEEASKQEEGTREEGAAPGVTNEEMVRAMLTLQRGMRGRLGTRYRSSLTIAGIPLLSVARGPDFEKGEMYGHARGIIAIGDVATGVFALGGLARGIFAMGGLALGFFSLGGCSVGLLLSVGGCSVGGIALGGCAIGGFAAGGMAIGYYAVGGQALGMHVLSPLKQDPALKQMVEGWLPVLKGLVGK